MELNYYKNIFISLAVVFCMVGNVSLAMEGNPSLNPCLLDTGFSKPPKTFKASTYGIKKSTQSFEAWDRRKESISPGELFEQVKKSENGSNPITVIAKARKAQKRLKEKKKGGSRSLVFENKEKVFLDKKKSGKSNSVPSLFFIRRGGNTLRKRSLNDLNRKSSGKKKRPSSCSLGRKKANNITPNYYGFLANSDELNQLKIEEKINKKRAEK